jgi:N-acetylmuramoyl-L-alanine amidase
MTFGLRQKVFKEKTFLKSFLLNIPLSKIRGLIALYMDKKKHYLLIILITMVFVSGCATHAPYFKLDSSLMKDVRSFNGFQYLSLSKVCDVYSLDCKWDSFIKTATIQKGSNRIVLRADSNTMLLNGEIRKLDKPVVFYNNAVFVPISFVRNNLAPALGTAAVLTVRPEAEASRRVSIKTIVLDPGHGGRDVGATGRRIRVKEKDRALYLARKIRDILEGAGIRVIMTRDDDTFIPLPKRAEIANRGNADLFVSVHINASRSRMLRGFECYYLSNATDDNARAVEAVENASLKLGDTANLEHSGTLDKTLWDMTLTENRIESAQLANYVCDSIDKNATTANRGIKSARFYVLKYTRMPSILVEAGYLSNRYEELKIKDNAFLDRVAAAVTDGILRYKSEYERTEGFTRK